MSIILLRSKIKKLTIKKLKAQDKLSINGSNIKYIFNLYDKIFFNFQISKKLGETKSNINFIASKRENKYIGLCIKSDNLFYIIDIAPNILERYYTNKNYKINEGDRIDLLLKVIENLIVHLLMLLWKYHNSKISLFSKHGDLFKCMLLKLFNDTFEFPLTSIIIKKNKLQTIGFKWVDNSCYLDSLLIVLFFCDSDYWRENLLRYDITNNEYDHIFCDLKGGSKINTIEKIKTLAEQIQIQLVNDYNSLLNFENKLTKGENLTCSLLRNLLKKCLPNMIVNKKWTFYNVGALYTLLSDIFPNIKIKTPIKNNFDPEIKIEYNSYFTIWDYLEGKEEEKGEEYKFIRWDLIESEILVFYNTGIPRIKKLNKIGNEKIKFTIDDTSYKYDIDKKTKFDIHILDNKYELIGVILLKGISKGKEGGSHYVANLRIKNEWYEYDDTSPSFNPIDNILNVFEEKNGIMPSMYFYKRI